MQTKRIVTKCIHTTFKILLPNYTYNKLYSYYAYLTHQQKNLLLKNKQLKNFAKKKSAFLLATGPSINQENLKLIGGQDCFSVSNFFLHDDIKTINPMFHFFAGYHKPLTEESHLEWLNLADATLPKQTKMFLDIGDYQRVQKYKLFHKREIFYLYYNGYNYSKTNVDITKPILPPQTIPLMVLPVLFYMGYEKIYLLGCDHTTMRDHGREFFKAKNFYDPKKDIRRAISYEKANLNIIKVLTCVKNLFEQYEFYKNISQIQKTPQIINLSQDSWLDIFEFQKLNAIIKNQEDKYELQNM